MMRRAFTVVAVTMLLSSSVSAASTPATTIGLYVDDAHLQNCVPFTVSIGHYTVWSWCWANDNGVRAASFAVLYDGSGLVRGPVQTNTDVIDHYTGSDFMMGLTFYYKTCQYGWHWIHKEDLSEIQGPNRLKIQAGIMDHGGNVMTCQVNQPWASFAITTRAYLGNCTLIATQPVSWGAIKSLYSE